MAKSVDLCVCCGIVEESEELKGTEKTGAVTEQINFFSIKRPVLKCNTRALCSCLYYRREEYLSALSLIQCVLCICSEGNESGVDTEV